MVWIFAGTGPAGRRFLPPEPFECSDNERPECVKIGPFEFSMRELAGAMGDFGTLLPLAVGYISVCGLNPAGLLVAVGIANLVTGLTYRLPIPIEPMKVIAVIAIAHQWQPSMIYSAGFAMGAIWLVLSAAGIMDRVAAFTPASVVQGIQIALGVLLAVQALDLIAPSWLLGAVCVGIVLALKDNPYAPAAVVLVALGIGIMYFRGQLGAVEFTGPALPRLTMFRPGEILQSMLGAGFAQIPLTAANAIIATVALIKSYWPERDVRAGQLSLSTALMNLGSSFIGGMPMCHGAGGLAGQYYFGARTGGANIMEGSLEIGLGILLAGSIATLFALFPQPVIGAMMLLVGIQLVGVGRKARFGLDLVPLATTVAVSVWSNMGFGFVAGILAHYAMNRFARR